MEGISVWGIEAQERKRKIRKGRRRREFGIWNLE
jgi:hypothetical protein